MFRDILVKLEQMEESIKRMRKDIVKTINESLDLETLGIAEFLTEDVDLEEPEDDEVLNAPINKPRRKPEATPEKKAPLEDVGDIVDSSVEDEGEPKLPSVQIIRGDKQTEVSETPVETPTEEPVEEIVEEVVIDDDDTEELVEDTDEINMLDDEDDEEDDLSLDDEEDVGLEEIGGEEDLGDELVEDPKPFVELSIGDKFSFASEDDEDSVLEKISETEYMDKEGKKYRILDDTSMTVPATEDELSDEGGLLGGEEGLGDDLGDELDDELGGEEDLGDELDDLEDDEDTLGESINLDSLVRNILSNKDEN